MFQDLKCLEDETCSVLFRIISKAFTTPKKKSLKLIKNNLKISSGMVEMQIEFQNRNSPSSWFRVTPKQIKLKMVIAG